VTDNCRYGGNLQIWGGGQAQAPTRTVQNLREKVGQCIHSQFRNYLPHYLSEDSINHGQVGDDGNAPFMYMELRSGSFISLIIVLLVWVFLSIWVSH
jgi:hypothetical protein